MPPKNKRAKHAIAKRALENAGVEAEEEEEEEQEAEGGEEEEEYQGFGNYRKKLRQQVAGREEIWRRCWWRNG